MVLSAGGPRQVGAWPCQRLIEQHGHVAFAAPQHHAWSLRRLAEHAGQYSSSAPLVAMHCGPCRCPSPGIPGGRRAFHGERELYMSDHPDHIHSATILGRCVVHTLDAYRVGGLALDARWSQVAAQHTGSSAELRAHVPSCGAC